MYKRHLRVRGKHFKRYEGNAKQICETILKELWNGTYLETGKGNYPQFWSRDFGVMLPYLIALGYKKECERTLAYALERFKKKGKITTQITPKGKPVSFPNVPSPDSIALIFRSVTLLNNRELQKKYEGFLQKEAKRYQEEILDKEGKIRRHQHFSGMRDHAIRDAASYDLVMSYVMQQACKKLRIAFIQTDYKKTLLANYWNGEYFNDDMSNNTLSADANIYPFYYGLITEKKKLKKVINNIQEKGLDKPFPIKYVADKKEKGKMIWKEIFSKDWEADAIWPWAGLPYIEILARIDNKKATEHLKKYEQLIEKHGTFIEVYDKEGKPYKSPFFSTGEAMIWASMFLKLKENIK